MVLVQRWPSRFAFLGNYAVFFCFFYVLFLTLVPQVILGFITYSREELLNIRATSTHHHYDQEYDFPDFPEADPVFWLPPRTMDRIPAGDPKQRHRKRGSRSGLLVRLRRRVHRAPLPSILLSSLLTTRLMKSEQGQHSRETSETVTFFASQKHGSLERLYRSRCSQLVSSRIAPTGTSTILVRKGQGGMPYD